MKNARSSTRRVSAMAAMFLLCMACGDDESVVTPDATPDQPDAAPIEPDASSLLELTLVGTVSVGNATVEARTADAVIASTTADATGSYRLDVASAGAEVLHVRANDGATVALASVLANMTTLSARAGADGELTSDEFHGVDLTPVSTMRHAAIFVANGRAPVLSEEELVAAEHLMTAALTSAEMLYMAATLQLIVSSPDYDLPVGTTNTLALAEDLYAMRALMADIRLSTPDDIIRSTLEAMMTDPLMTADFSEAELPSAYYIGWIKHKNGHLGSGTTTLELDPGGAGRYHTADSVRRVRIPDLVSWTVTAAADGTRLSTVRAPTGENLQQTILTADGLAELFPGDPALQDQIRLAVGQNRVSVARERLGADRMLVAPGLAVDLAWSASRWRWLVSSPLADFGVTAPDVDRSVPAEGTLMFRDDGMNYLPLDQATMLGTWAMQLAVPADDDDLVDRFVAGDVLFSHALVTFFDDNTATATGGMLEAPMSLAWQIQPDGRLELTYPDDSRCVVALWSRQGLQHGFVSRYSAPGGELMISYWRALPTDPSFALAGPELHSQPGEYWKTTINIALYWPDAAGALPLDGEFGFRFNADGTSDNVQVSLSEGMPPELVVADFYDWRLDSGNVVINWWRDETYQPHCDPAGNNCFAGRERTWVPLAQDGPLLYVLEDYAAQADYFLMQWDAVDMRWEIGGQPADLSAREYLFAPRLNAYFVDAVPAL